MKKDIETIEDIKVVVNTFYAKIQKDELLGQIFNNKIKNNWDKHLEKMYTFWQTLLLNEHTYFGSAFHPHEKLPISKEHFDHWISLFKNTIDNNFSGPKSEEAKSRAENMALVFNYKIDYLKSNPKD